MQTITIYTADCRGNARNKSYPHRMEIHSAADLAHAVQFDHVCATYGDAKELNRGNEYTIRNKRSVETFIKADCLPMDLDNDHSENPDEWKTLDDVKAAFPGVMFYAVTSRHHMKAKEKSDGIHAPRQKYHLYFPIDEETDPVKYAAMKAEMFRRFPAFDDKALDAARFLFGVDGATVITVDGDNA